MRFSYPVQWMLKISFAHSLRDYVSVEGEQIECCAILVEIGWRAHTHERRESPTPMKVKLDFIH